MVSERHFDIDFGGHQFLLALCRLEPKLLQRLNCRFIKSVTEGPYYLNIMGQTIRSNHEEENYASLYFCLACLLRIQRVDPMHDDGRFVDARLRILMTTKFQKRPCVTVRSWLILCRYPAIDEQNDSDGNSEPKHELKYTPGRGYE